MVFVIVEIMQCFFHLLMPCNSKASSLEKKVFEKFGVWKIFSIISSGFFFVFFSFQKGKIFFINNMPHFFNK